MGKELHNRFFHETGRKFSRQNPGIWLAYRKWLRKLMLGGKDESKDETRNTDKR